jgi:hypothetical protein
VQLDCRLRPVIGWLKTGRLAAILATGDLIERYKLAVPFGSSVIGEDGAAGEVDQAPGPWPP